MDDADYAIQAEERAWQDIERRIAAAREHPPAPTRPRSLCQDCEEPLPVHRLAYGICVPCAEEAERRQRLWGHA